MSEAKDTLLMLFSLLRLNPTKSQRVVTPTWLEKLQDRGFSATFGPSSVASRAVRFLFPCSAMTTRLHVAGALPDNTLIDLSGMDAFNYFGTELPW